MNINLRRLLALAFIAGFFILLPIILNYARGYRFDANKNQMVSTGGISVNSNPKNAQVFLNGNYEEPNLFEKFLLPFKNFLGMRKMGGTTPAIFQNLIPDEYNIEVTKDGYYPWQKKINVYAEQVVFAENINLFLQNPKIENLATADILLAKFSPNEDKLIYTTKNEDKWELYALDLANLENKLLYKSSYEIEKIVWSNIGSSLYLKTKNNNEYVFIDTNDTTKTFYLKNFTSITNLSLKSTALELTNLKWDANNSDKLYFQNKNKIYEINLTTQTVDNFHEFAYQDTKSIADFFVKDGSIWAIQLFSEEAELKKFAQQKTAPSTENEISQTISILPSSNQYQFVDYKNDLIAIKNIQSKNIFIINPQINHLERSVIAKFFANDFVWDNQQNRILYWDNFEAGIINLNKNDEYAQSYQEVLSRYSQQISGAYWSEDENYVILGLEKELSAIEIDNRDKRNISQITVVNSINSFDLKNKNIVYLIGKINNVSGIYKIETQ
ncbi:MAG: hypothetical protein WCX88_00045 [Patescibacteria group bacterium]